MPAASVVEDESRDNGAAAVHTSWISQLLLCNLGSFRITHICNGCAGAILHEPLANQRPFRFHVLGVMALAEEYVLILICIPVLTVTVACCP